MKYPFRLQVLTTLTSVALATGLMYPKPVHADWKLLDDFENYDLGAVNAADSPWTGHRSTTTTHFVEEEGERFLTFGWGGTSAYRSVSRPLPEFLAVHPGESVTLFLRFRSDSAGTNDANFGLAFDPATDDHGPVDTFRVQTGLRPNAAADVHDFGVWDGGAFRPLAQIDVGTWYNLWYVIDRGSDTFQLYMTTGTDDATVADLLSDGGIETFSFRSGGSATDVLNHLLGAGNMGGSSQGTHLDNIWMDKSGANLSYVSMETLPAAIQWPFYAQFGSDGMGDGEPFTRNVVSDWSLQPEALRLATEDVVLHDSFAMADVVNLGPESDLAVRARMTLTSLGSGTADNAVGVTILGTGEPGTTDEFYHAQWIPNSAAGSRIRIVAGTNGTVLADEAWTGLRPTGANPGDGIGTTYTFLAFAKYEENGDLNLTFRLSDEGGHAQDVSAVIPNPLQGSWFGFGARHSGGQNPVWDFADFSVTEPWQLDFETFAAPFSLTFGMNTGDDSGEGLLRSRPEGFELQWDALRYTSSGGFTSVAALTPVNNYINRQDFAVESEMTFRQFEDVSLQRVGFVVLGGPHVPIEEPFDTTLDSGFYGLIWYPAVDSGGEIVSRLQIREGFNGAVLKEEIWEGLHPSVANGGTGGINNRYYLKGEGVYDEVGGLVLSFTLSDNVAAGAGHTQTISLELPTPHEGNVFGFGGRLTDGEFQDPQFDFHTFAMSVGEPPTDIVPDPAVTWPFEFAYGSDTGRNDDTDLRQNIEEDWSLEPEALRLSPNVAAYHNSLATTRVFNFEAGTDFFIRAKFTVENLAAIEAENRVAIALFGNSNLEAFDPDDDSSYHTIQWIPAGPSGGSLVMRAGMDGIEVARTDFSGLENPPVLTVGSSYDLYFHARYREGGALDFHGILVDAGGREAIVAGTLPSPPAGNRFGFGARHRSTDNPVWDFQEFVWLGNADRPDRTIVGNPVAVYATPGRNPDDTATANVIGRRNVIDPDTGEPRHDGSYSTLDEYTFATNSFVGNAGNVPDARMHSTFLFFELPALDGEEWIDYADLSLVRIDEGRTTGPGNVDIYGLGFASATTLSTDNWYAGPDDVTEGVSKLQDDYLLSGDNTTTGRIATSIDGNEEIALFLQSLYDSGAQPGDYAVIRISYDIDRSPNSGNTQRFTFQSTSGAQGADDPILTFYVAGGAAGATFAGWQEDNFTPAELLDPSVSGPDAAPAGDGIPNLLKYVMNFEAKVPFMGGSLFASAIVNGDLTMTYFERPDVQDVEYIVEASSDLVNWESGPAHVEEIGRVNDGDLQIVTVRAVLSGVEGRAFLRLRLQEL